MDGIDRKKRSCLHLVAATGDGPLEECLAQARPGDAILFLDAGVLHLLSRTVSTRMRTDRAFLFAAVDLEAHGLLTAARAAGVTIVGDAEWCGLLAEHAHCLTWT
jgi:sulfur relay protein TusB/DsrH